MGGAEFVAGTATAVGSLPHYDAHAAAALVLRVLPDLPAAPQLPHRNAREEMVAQWAAAVPGIDVRPDGSLELTDRVDASRPIDTTFTTDAHDGLLTFLAIAARQPRLPERVKVQVAGPLTLGVALADAGVSTSLAFAVGASAARAWARAVVERVEAVLPDARVVLFFDEPALVCWRRDAAPIEREVAIDLLSGALASTRALTGVHVCGAGDLRLALDAGPNVVHCDVDALDLDHGVALSRFLDGGGWVAWGAIPTHRPVGEHAQPLWKALLDTWCELTRRGCDPARLRAQALVAPACGLAGHGVSQAERAMHLAREIGGRVRDHAAACKLAVGA
jgi:methionine synthase II (cobalamin-independent)